MGKSLPVKTWKTLKFDVISNNYNEIISKDFIRFDIEILISFR
jgi:hypothetical protein